MLTPNTRIGDFILKTAALSLLIFCLSASKSYAQIGIIPVITAQPTNTIVSNGGTATFHVEVYSLLGVTYSWYHNNVKMTNSTRITGATAATCIISNVGYADGGNYYVEARNLIGPVNSDTVTLSLIYPSVLITSAQMVTNGFRMQMSGPNASNYVVSASTNLNNWTAISTNPAFSGNVIFTDTTAQSRRMRFYRSAAQ